MRQIGNITIDLTSSGWIFGVEEKFLAPFKKWEDHYVSLGDFQARLRELGADETSIHLTVTNLQYMGVHLPPDVETRESRELYAQLPDQTTLLRGVSLTQPRLALGTISNSPKKLCVTIPYPQRIAKIKHDKYG